MFKEKRSMFTTFPNALDGVISALGSQDHTIRQQGQAVLKDMLEASRHELAAAEQKEERLKKKVKQCEAELAIKETQLNNLEPPKDLWRKRSYIAKHHRWNENRGNIEFICALIKEAKQQKFKLNNHLARVKEQIQAIEAHKAQYQSENAEILQTIQKLSGEEVEKAHTDSTLHSQEPSSSELASGDALTLQQHAEVARQIKILDEQVTQTNDNDTKLMLEAKMGAMRDRTWRDQWITKRPWDGAVEEEQEVK
jgi:chromosome segregation ATPase